METAGEERVRAINSLRQLEEGAKLLEHASKSLQSVSFTMNFPSSLSGNLHAVTAMSSREDAERLLSTGISMWNSVIALEGRELDQSTSKALVRVRHVAADCVYMSTCVLGGISDEFNVDNFCLMNFYIACGQKYANDLCDMDMAELCFQKAGDFADGAKKELASTSKEDGLARAVFDLHLGRAECCWEKGDSDAAERYVDQARNYLPELPDEHEFLASVEYNFGLFKYQEKDTKKALHWLRRSLNTRGKPENTGMDREKQARTMRLTGVCLLALQEFKGSFEMMENAQNLYSDPVGAYLMLKLSMITKQSDISDLLIQTISDEKCSIDIAMACVSLFGDAMRARDAIKGYEQLFARFQADKSVIVCTIGPRYFEVLTTTGAYDKAIEVFRVCRSSIEELSTQSDCITDKNSKLCSEESCREHQRARWSALVLSMGSGLADKKDFYHATLFLREAIDLARSQISDNGKETDDSKHSVVQNIVLENEASVCRLVASCALCAMKASLEPHSHSRSDKDVSMGDNNFDSKNEQLCSIARAHAERAKALEPHDFAPRLLLFRVELQAGRHEAAALVLKQASQDITSFDPGALAEAACAARDVGSRESVITALQCILRMDPHQLQNALKSVTTTKGFYGTILISCVSFILEADKSSESLSTSNPSLLKDEGKSDVSVQNSQYLMETMKFGMRGIQALGSSTTFGNDETETSKGILFLARVAWNQGRAAGLNLKYEQWIGYFILCHDFVQLLPQSSQSLHMQRIARLMSACGYIESPSRSSDDCKRARKFLEEARQYSNALKKFASNKKERPIENFLLTLEARACVGHFDLEGLTAVVKASLSYSDIKAGALEQLTAICHSYKPTSEQAEGDWATKVTDLKAGLLSKAVDKRVCENEKDFKALAIAIRENLSLELSRGSTRARMFSEFRKAVNYAMEYQDSYPEDEVRWLLAAGWDRIQMFSRIGAHDEAHRWCVILLRFIDTCVSLSAYRPKVLSFKAVLDNKLSSQK